MNNYKNLIILLVIITIFLQINLVTSNTNIHKRRHHRHIPNRLTKLLIDDDLDNISSESELNLNNLDINHEKKSIDETVPAAITNCANCENSNNNKIKISEIELTELRIEYVKNQILKKLKLKERPRNIVNHKIAEGETFNSVLKVNNENNRVFDDFYAKTTQKIFFQKDDANICKNLINANPRNCFSFELNNNIEDVDVNMAELWFYKYPFVDDVDYEHTFVISEVINWESTNHNFIKTNPIAIQTNTNVRVGWIKIDILWAVKNWFKHTDTNHILHVSCTTCNDNTTIFLPQQKYKPFIVINTNPRKHIRRQKRNVNCSSGVTECCREKLYISFSEIGWDDWILYPQGYDAYFCRGSCSSVATVTMSGSHYNSVLRKVIFHRKNMGGKSLELIPCCTATRFSSLQLFYMDSNNTAVQKTLPNMVVEDCGCM